MKTLPDVTPENIQLSNNSGKSKSKKVAPHGNSGGKQLRASKLSEKKQYAAKITINSKLPSEEKKKSRIPTNRSDIFTFLLNHKVYNQNVDKSQQSTSIESNAAANRKKKDLL